MTDVELAKRALAHGAVDYVTKPIDMPHLLDCLAAAVEFNRLGESEGLAQQRGG